MISFLLKDKNKNNLDLQSKNKTQTMESDGCGFVSKPDENELCDLE